MAIPASRFRFCASRRACCCSRCPQRQWVQPFRSLRDGMVRGASRAAVDAGWLYTANTIGAALGTVLAGFLLLPALGLLHTMQVGVALNLIAATVALADGGNTCAAELRPTEEATTQVRHSGNRRSKHAKLSRRAQGVGLLWTAALALGLSGFASLTLQVVWTRLAALILGPTTYAFSVVVAVSIGGLAAGSAIASRLVARSRQPVLGLAVCLLSSVGLAPAAASGVDRALLFMAEFVAAENASFSGLLIRQALLVASLLAPMSIAFGAAFPFAIAVGTKADETVMSDLGVIYAANTSGAIIGALLAGFVLITSLGLHDTIRVVTLIVAVCDTCSAHPDTCPGPSPRDRLRHLRAGPPPWIHASVVEPAVSCRVASTSPHPMLGVPIWRLGSPPVASSITAKAPPQRSRCARRSARDRFRSMERSTRRTWADMLTQRLLAHVPLLLHPDPHRVAIVGLGSGVTLGAALTHPIARADVLEISPEVVEASRFFEQENHRRARRFPHASDRWRRSPAPNAFPVTVRCDYFGAVEPLDGGRRFAVHARVLRIGAPQSGTRRSVVPVGAHLRHQRQRPSIDRGDVSVGVPRRLSMAHRRRRRAAGGNQRTTRHAIR